MNDVENDLILLRSLVARELETINCYRLLARECEDDSTVEFIQHIIEEEKFHIADTLQAIARIDAAQADLFERGFGEGHSPGELPSVIAESAIGASPTSSNSDTTADHRDRVGLLKSNRTTNQELEIDATREPDFQSDIETKSSMRGGADIPNPAVEARVGTRSDSSWTVGSLRGVPQNK